jgi:hypothetical protein
VLGESEKREREEGKKIKREIEKEEQTNTPIIWKQ